MVYTIFGQQHIHVSESDKNEFKTHSRIHKKYSPIHVMPLRNYKYFITNNATIKCQFQDKTINVQVCNTVGELTFGLHFIANIADRKSRHRILFYPIKERVKIT